MVHTKNMEAVTMPKQGQSIVATRYGIEKTKTQGGNSLKVAEIKRDILDSGAASIYIKMGLTGRDIRIVDGKEEDIGELEQTERMKCLKTVVDYVVPKAKESAEESNNTIEAWTKYLEQKKTP